MTDDIKHSPYLTQDEIELLVKAGVDTTDESFSSPAFKDYIIKARNVPHIPKAFHNGLFNWIFGDDFQANPYQPHPSQRQNLMYELINHCYYAVERLKEEGLESVERGSEE